VSLVAAAIQMPSEPGRPRTNLDRADALLERAAGQGAELAVLPEMFNTGYGKRHDYGDLAERRDGSMLRHLAERSRRWGMAIAAGFVEGDGGHLYDALAYCDPDGGLQVYRKRNLVFWEPSRFQRGGEPLVVPTRWGRIGFTICADMIYRRTWREYRGKIDLAVIAAAWPQFADEATGRPHWLFGRIGPLAGEIPRMVAHDLGIPVIFANQCGATRTTIPVMPPIADTFAGLSALCDGRRALPVRAGDGEEIVVARLTPLAEPTPLADEGTDPCRIMSRSVRAAS